MAKKFANKPTFVGLAADKLISDDNLNVRLGANTNTFGVKVEKDGYDLATMESQIVDAGRILKPLTVWKKQDGTYYVLRGNRRVRAAQALLKRTDISDELRKELNNIPCEVYNDLTEADAINIVNDHDTKELSRAELVLNVWRLSTAGYNEKDIINMLLYQLADYTGNKKKINTLPENPIERSQALYKWLHGTVGGYLLAAYRMGPRVQKALIATELMNDGLLKEKEKPEFRVTSSRVIHNGLTAALNQDLEGAGWNPQDGGVAFNALIEKYIKEDNGEGSGPRETRPSKKDIDDKKLSSLSSVAQAAYSIANGKPVMSMHELDREAYRAEQVMNKLASVCNDLIDEKVKQLIRTILYGTPDEVAAIMTDYLPKK